MAGRRARRARRGSAEEMGGVLPGCVWCLAGFHRRIRGAEKEKDGVADTKRKSEKLGSWAELLGFVAELERGTRPAVLDISSVSRLARHNHRPRLYSAKAFVQN